MKNEDADVEVAKINDMQVLISFPGGCGAPIC
jgi:hypothetical protein